MAHKKQPDYIKGTATHRRTEGDYMGVLLDTVTLDDWRDVVAGAMQAAKGGDPAARAWLAQYLVGKPAVKAPSPLTVVIQQLSGADPVVEKLARPVIDRELYHTPRSSDAWEVGIKGMIAAELAQKLPAPETATTPVTAGDSGESAG
jgi:hypothetical protein